MKSRGRLSGASPAFPMSFSTAAIGSTETSSLKSKRARGQSKPRPVDALHSGASNAQTADHVKKAPPAIRPFFPRDDGGGARAHRLHFRHDLAPGGRNDRRHRRYRSADAPSLREFESGGRGGQRQHGRHLPGRRLRPQHGAFRADPQSAPRIFPPARSRLHHGRSLQNDVSRLSDRDQRHRCHRRLTPWYPRRVSARRTDPLQTNGSYDASHWVKRSSSATIRSASHSSSSRIETARFSLYGEVDGIVGAAGRAQPQAFRPDHDIDVARRERRLPGPRTKG